MATFFSIFFVFPFLEGGVPSQTMFTSGIQLRSRLSCRLISKSFQQRTNCRCFVSILSLAHHQFVTCWLLFLFVCLLSLAPHCVCRVVYYYIQLAWRPTTRQRERFLSIALSTAGVIGFVSRSSQLDVDGDNAVKTQAYDDLMLIQLFSLSLPLPNPTASLA